MTLQLHHLHPGHDDELTRLKARIAELESTIDKEKSWSDTLRKNGVTMSHEIEPMRKILIVNHGGQHNDTICTLEEKVNDYNEA